MQKKNKLESKLEKLNAKKFSKTDFNQVQVIGGRACGGHWLPYMSYGCGGNCSSTDWAEVFNSCC